MSFQLDNYDYTWHSYTANFPSKVNLGENSAEQAYTINLDTRQILGPAVISVQDDHNAELIFFKVDRYYDRFDLANTSCIIQFNTTDAKTGKPFHGLYPVEFYDIETLVGENKIIIPWSIPRSVTQSAQEIEYNFRFFVIDLDANKLIYNLNTLPSKAKVLKTLPLYDNAYNLDLLDQDLATYNYDRLVQMYNTFMNYHKLHWEDAETLLNQN